MRNGLRRCSLDSQCSQDERAAVEAHAHYAATFITRAALVGVVDRPDGRFYVIEVAIGSAVYATERRYSELAALNSFIRRLRPALAAALPAFPRKTSMRVRLRLKRQALNWLDERRRQLAAWVSAFMEQVPDVALKELLWRGANWREVPRALDGASRFLNTSSNSRNGKPELDRLSERTTVGTSSRAGSFTSTTA
jgi:hypothetical protein